MMLIAKKYGMSVVRDSGEAQGTMELEAPDVVTLLGEVIGDGIALWDYAAMAAPSVWNPGFAATLPMNVRAA